MMDTTTDRHPGDGDLVRLADGELAAQDAAALRDHVAHCPACADRLNRIRRTTETLDALLTTSGERIRPPAPARTRPRRWWRAAAAIALLLAAGLLAPPVRAWVAQGVEAVLAGLEDGVDEADGEGSSGPATTVLQFAVPPDRLVLDATGVGSGAVLEIRRVEGTAAVLEIESPSAGVVVTADGFRLVGGGTGAVYRLGLPAAVGSVWLRRAGTEAGEEVEVSGDGRVPLGGGAR